MPPRRHLLLLAVLTAAVAAYAQVPASTAMPPDYSGVHTEVGGVYVTPVPNAPFSAEVHIVSHRKLPDGTEHVVTTINHIARSSSGRIYNERRQLVPADFRGMPRLLSARVYDPNSRVSLNAFPAMRLVRKYTLRSPEKLPASAQPPEQRRSGPGVTETDLGNQSLDGVQLHGLRKERIVPAELSGTGKAVTVTDDYWYSPALSRYMTIRHDDPRTGEQLVAVVKVETGEPSAETFVFPAEYKLVDETAPDAPAYPPPGAPLPQ